MTASNQFLGQYVPQVRQNQGITALDQALDTIYERNQQRKAQELAAQQFQEQQARLAYASQLTADTQRAVKGMDIDWQRQKAKQEAQQKDREALAGLLTSDKSTYQHPAILNKVASLYGADLNQPISPGQPTNAPAQDTPVAPPQMDGSQAPANVPPPLEAHAAPMGEPAQAPVAPTTNTQTMMQAIASRRAQMPQADDFSDVSTKGSLFKIRNEILPRVQRKYSSLVAAGQVEPKEAIRLVKEETDAAVKAIADQRRIDKPSGNGGGGMDLETARLFIAAQGAVDRQSGGPIPKQKYEAAYHDAKDFSRLADEYIGVISDPKTTQQQRRDKAAGVVEMWNKKIKEAHGQTVTGNEVGRMNYASSLVDRLADEILHASSGGFSVAKARELKAGADEMAGIFEKRIRDEEEKRKTGLKAMSNALPMLKSPTDAFLGNKGYQILPEEQPISTPKGIDPNDPAYREKVKQKIEELEAKKAAAKAKANK